MFEIVTAVDEALDNINKGHIQLVVGFLGELRSRGVVATELLAAGQEALSSTEEDGRATELEYLKYFYQNADFGPADGDVRVWMNEGFMKATGKQLPKGYEEE